jgi:hypothetical protein
MKNKKRNECHGQKSKEDRRWEDDGETCGESSIRDYFLAPWPQLNLAAGLLAVTHAPYICNFGPTLGKHLKRSFYTSA